MKSRPGAVFVDTWAWLAFGHRRDQAHEQVKEIFLEMQARQIPLYTSDYVLDELITLLFKRENHSMGVAFLEGILASQTQGRICLEWVDLERFHRTWELRKKLQDKPRISFTDLSSMIIMQERGIESVLSDDQHFIQVGFGFNLLPGQYL